MTPDIVYGLAGAALVAIGLYRAVVTEELLRRVLAINVLATGIASMLLATGVRAGTSDPVPQAFVLTGIVVLVSTTAVALALIRRLHEDHHDE